MDGFVEVTAAFFGAGSCDAKGFAPQTATPQFQLGGKMR